jgi:cardiolipin synthase
MYIFENNTHGYDFLSELERKAREGVRVVIILDAMGSSLLPAYAVDRLRIAGAEVLFFSHWFRRMHQKILIVDRQIAFIGGVNIAGKYAKWRDLHVRLSGKIIRPMCASFSRMYQDCGGTNAALKVSGTRNGVLKKTKLWFVEHAPMHKKNSLREHYVRHINESKGSLTLVTPYFLPHRWLIAALHQAILRGVSVSIIIPKRSDFWAADQANYYYLELLHNLGAVCYLSPAMNHAKVMLSGQEGVVGSQNIDALSFDWNAEAGVFFTEPHMLRDLTVIVGNWKTDAALFNPGEHRARWHIRLIATILPFFQPIL